MYMIFHKNYNKVYILQQIELSKCARTISFVPYPYPLSIKMAKYLGFLYGGSR